MAVPMTQHFAGAETGDIDRDYPAEFDDGQFVGVGVASTPGAHHSKQSHYFDIISTGPDSESPLPRFAETPAISVGTSDFLEISLFFYGLNLGADNAANVRIMATLRAGGEEMGLYLIEGATAGTWDRLRLVDANFTQVGSDLDVIQDGVWHQITIKFDRSGSSPIKLWFDGVLKIDETGKDFFDSSGDVVVRYGFKDTVPGIILPTPSFDTFLGACKVSTDASAGIDDNDPIGIFTVLGPYNDTDQAVSPDFGGSLNSGRWDDASLIEDDSTHADYNINVTGGGRAGGVTADDGTHAGPDADSDADNSILAYSGVWRYRKNGSSGTAGTFTGKLGFDIHEPSTPTVDQTTEYPFGALSTSWVTSHVVVAGGFLFDNMQVGMKVVKTSGTFPVREAECSFMGGFILHEEEVVVSERIVITDGFRQTVT